MSEPMEVVGMEGSCTERVPDLTWGAAALRCGDRLYNPVTGSVSSMTGHGGFAELAVEGHVTALPQTIPIPLGLDVTDAVVVAVALDRSWTDLLVQGFVPALSRTSPDRIWALFCPHPAFDRWVEDRVSAMLARLSALPDEEGLRLVALGLILSCHHPELWIEHVVRLPPGKRPLGRRMGLAMMREEAARMRFCAALDPQGNRRV